MIKLDMLAAPRDTTDDTSETDCLRHVELGRGPAFLALNGQVSGTSLAGGGALLNSRMLLGGGAQPPQHEQLTSRGGCSTPPARTIDF